MIGKWLKNHLNHLPQHRSEILQNSMCQHAARFVGWERWNPRSRFQGAIHEMDRSRMFRREKNDFAIVFAITLLSLLVSKGLALVPAFGLDDYSVLHENRYPEFYLGQGRFVQAAIQVLLSSLGLSTTSISWVSIFLFFGFAAWAITQGIFHVAEDKGKVIGLAAIGAVIASHPYLTEYFTFRESLITQGTAFLLLGLVLMVASRPVSGLWATVGVWILLVSLMVMLAGTQQTAFIILGFFILARFLQRTLIADGEFNVRVRNGSTWLLGFYLLAAVAYVAIVLILQKATGVDQDSRNSIVGFDQLRRRSEMILSLTGKVLIHREPVLSLGVKWFAYLLLLILLAAGNWRRPGKLLLLVATVAVFYLGSIFLVSVSGVWWPVPRAIYGFGFALGISLLLAYLNYHGHLQRIFPVLMFIAAAGFSLHSSALLHDQIRLNRWDAWVASGILHDVIAAGGDSESRIVLIGASWRHSLALTSTDGDLNISALPVAKASDDLFMEATGRKWKVEVVATAPECGGAQIWPNRGAVRRVGDAFYVCMGPSR